MQMKQSIVGLVVLLCFCNQITGQLTQAPTPNVGWFSQTLDHFAFEPANEWQQRYLWTDVYYDASKPNGALFFYTGNEGDIYMFWNNTGFLFDLAQQLNARVLFCEHRYVRFIFVKSFIVMNMNSHPSFDTTTRHTRISMENLSHSEKHRCFILDTYQVNKHSPTMPASFNGINRSPRQFCR